MNTHKQLKRSQNEYDVCITLECRSKSLYENTCDIDDYDKALKIKPYHIDAVLQCAECHQYLDNFESSIKCYEAALNNEAIKDDDVKLIKLKIAAASKRKDAKSKISLGRANFAAKMYKNAVNN